MIASTINFGKPSTIFDVELPGVRVSISLSFVPPSPCLVRKEGVGRVIYLILSLFYFFYFLDLIFRKLAST